MFSNKLPAAMLLAVALSTGCSQQKPAEQAVDKAEQALSEVHELALRYAPKEYGEAKAELDGARKALAEGKYTEALKAARELPAKAGEIGEAAAATRDALAEKFGDEWAALSEPMAARLAAFEARVAELEQAQRLPKGVEKRAVEESRRALEVTTKSWGDAQAAHAAGDVESAVRQGRACDLMITRVMESLGVAPEPAPQAPAS